MILHHSWVVPEALVSVADLLLVLTSSILLLLLKIGVLTLEGL